jgi:hypothetical protein
MKIQGVENVRKIRRHPCWRSYKGLVVWIELGVVGVAGCMLREVSVVSLDNGCLVKNTPLMYREEVDVRVC